MISKLITLGSSKLLFLSDALFCQACSLTVPIDAPEESVNRYDVAESDKINFSFANKLGEQHQASNSTLPVPIGFKYEGGMFDTAAVVEKNLVEELDARGFDVSIAGDDANSIELNGFEILSHRSNGFSPMVTLSSLVVDVNYNGDAKHFVSFVKRAKVPVWTMSEINEPCYNQPLEIMIKEVVAKINRNYFNYSLPDEKVVSLIDSVRENHKKNGLAYMDVYELAFSNNELAVPALNEFAKYDNEYVRLAAISGLGIIGAEGSEADLIAIYEGKSIWQDKGMALKALGDLGTDKALAFLKAEREKIASSTKRDAVWNKKIIDLYL